jgi:2-dehydropantoate 2-reductase
MNITIIGPGAIGGWLGATLALAGEDVTMVVRSGQALPDSLVLSSRGAQQTAPLRFVPSDHVPPAPAELLLLTTKATALADAAETARPWIGPDTLIVPMQNGVPYWFAGEGMQLASVDPDGRIAAALPINQVIGSVVHAAVRRSAPGRIELVHADKLLLGEPGGGPSDRVAALVARLSGGGLPALAHADIRQALWYKAWGNMTINPVSALTGAAADRIVGDVALRPFLLAAMAEAAAIGAAYGCPIADSGEARLAVTARLGAFKTSMLQDAEAARPLEHEALVGAPRELARRKGIATPALDIVHALVAQKDAVLQASVASPAT